MSDPSCNAAEAVLRAMSIARKGGQYIMGTGDYRPSLVIAAGVAVTTDLPWTSNANGLGSDCAGFAICWCWKLRRNRPGFNKGSWASVEDDINCNSALEDAQHKQELFTLVKPGEEVRPGDLLIYPTFYLAGHPKPWIGHVCIVIRVPPGWVLGKNRFSELTVAQCHGPDTFTPGVVITDGSIWDQHDHMWPGELQRSYVVRPKDRA